MKRIIQLLLVLLIIQMVIMVAVFWPQNSVQATDDPLFAELSADNVVRLTILDGDDNRLVIAKEGDTWLLPEAGDYPVDPEKVDTLLETLAGLKANRLVTQTEASHKRLKVAPDDFDRLLEITLADETQHKLYIGTSAGVGATHSRIDDQPEVFLSEVQVFDVNPQVSGWIDTLYHTVGQEDVVALTLENAQGLFAFEKDGDNWVMLDLAEGAEFDETKFNSLLNQAMSLRMTLPLGQEENEAYKLHEPLATVTLKTLTNDEENSYTLQVGARLDENGYVVKSSESPYYVQVGELSANNFIEKSQDDFLLVPTADDAENIEETTDVQLEGE